MTTPAPEPSDVLRHRIWHVVGAVAVGVAATGFLAGVAGPPERAAPQRGEEERSTEGPAVRRYSEMGSDSRGPNANLYERGTSVLAVERDPYTVVERTDAERAATLRARDERRAYDGAPPTIPHPIDQRGSPDCLACHGAAVQIDGRIAPTMSHPRYDSCTQCHVVAADPRPGGAAPEGVPNTFVGTSSENAGARAWPGAPPTIPHATSMRADCLSCHGSLGRVGLRTSHPWRQSCTQCHAPSAELDQRGPTPSP